MRSTLISLRNNNSRNKSPKYFIQQSAKKPRQKMPTIYRHKIYDKSFYYNNQKKNNLNNNPQINLDFTMPMRKTRLDFQIQKQRNQMINKTGLNSYDNPQWMNTTLKYYKKSNYSSLSKQDILQEKSYNPLTNQKKKQYQQNKRSEDNYYNKMINQQIFHSIQLKNKRIRQRNFYDSQIDRTMRATLSWRQENQRQISPKIGALNHRDFTIRKPLLKIGKQLYVNTYSPFQKF